MRSNSAGDPCSLGRRGICCTQFTSLLMDSWSWKQWPKKWWNEQRAWASVSGPGAGTSSCCFWTVKKGMPTRSRRSGLPGDNWRTEVSVIYSVCVRPFGEDLRRRTDFLRERQQCWSSNIKIAIADSLSSENVKIFHRHSSENNLPKVGFKNCSICFLKEGRPDCLELNLCYRI